MSEQQSCGACKWFDPQGDEVWVCGQCTWQPETKLPNSLIRIGPADSDGTDCPTFERKETDK